MVSLEHRRPLLLRYLSENLKSSSSQSVCSSFCTGRSFLRGSSVGSSPSAGSLEFSARGHEADLSASSYPLPCLSLSIRFAKRRAVGEVWSQQFLLFSALSASAVSLERSKPPTACTIWCSEAPPRRAARTRDMCSGLRESPFIKSNPITGHGFGLGGYIIGMPYDRQLPSVARRRNGGPRTCIFRGLARASGLVWATELSLRHVRIRRVGRRIGLQLYRIHHEQTRSVAEGESHADFFPARDRDCSELRVLFGNELHSDRLINRCGIHISARGVFRPAGGRAKRTRRRAS